MKITKEQIINELQELLNEWDTDIDEQREYHECRIEEETCTCATCSFHRNAIEDLDRRGFHSFVNFILNYESIKK